MKIPTAALLVASTLFATAASAATYSWQTTGTTDNWSTAPGDTNWYVDAGTTLSQWSDSNAAVFSGTGETVTLSGTVSATGVTFGATGFTLTGGTLALTGTPAIAVTNSADSATISSVLAGSAGLTKSGAGTLTLGGTNTFSGQFLITGGTVKAGAAAALGATGAGNETLVSGGGTFDINGQAIAAAEIIRIAGTGVGGNGALVNTGASQQNALNNLTLTADASVGGTARFDLRTGTPSLDLAGFKLTKVGSNQLSLVGTAVTNGSIDVNAGTLSIETTSVVQGTGTITVNAGGTLAFYGTTAANITRAIVGNGGTISNTGSTAGVNSAITLNTSTSTTFGTAAAVTTTFGGVISGGGALVKTGTDTVALSAANTYTGGTTVNGGILDITGGGGSNGAIRGTATVNTGGTLRLSTGDATGYTAGAGALSAINLVGGTLNVNTTSNQTLGSAVITLTGGSITGIAGSNIDLFAGSSSIATAASSVTSTISGTALSLRQNNTVFNTAGGGTTASGVDLLINSNIGSKTDAGNQSLVKNGAGRMALAGANTYTGTTTINSGTLQLTATGTLASSAVTVNSGGTLQIDSTGKTLSAITLNNGSALTVAGQVGSTTTVAGALTFGAGATVTINPLITGTVAVGNVINLITAGSISGTPTSLVTNLAGSRITGTTAVSGNTLQFTVATAGLNLLWNNGAATGIWDNASNNFYNGTGNDKFYNYDSVTFDDTAGVGVKTVTLSGQLSPSAITVTGTTDYVFAGSGTLTGSGSLTKNGSGSLTLSSGYLLGGAINMNAGTLNLNGNSLSGASALVLAGGTVSNGTLSAGAFNLQSGTVSAVLAGNGAVTKSTSGTVTLSGANTYTGGTTVAGGVLIVASAGALGSGALTINSGAEARIGAAIGNRVINVGGTLNLALGGNVYVADPSQINFTTNNASIGTYGTGANAVIRDFDVNSVAVNVNAGVTGATIASTVDLNSTSGFGFRIDVGAGGDLTVNGAITGAGNAGAAVNAGAMVGTDSTSFYKRGLGSLTLTGVSSFTAGSNVAATSIEGTLIIAGGDNRLPTNSAVYLGTVTTNNNGAGILALAGVNQTITGLTNVGTNTGSKVVGASATLSTLTINNTNAYTFSGALGGVGTNENNLAIVKNGSGVMTFSGTNTYIGNTTVNAGTVALTSTGSLLFKISNGNVSNGISGTGTLTLDGTFNLDITGFSGGTGSWTLVSASTLNESYGSNFVLKFNGGSSFTNNAGIWTNGSWTYNQATGVLTAVPEPSTYGLLGAGALAAVAMVRRRRKGVAAAV